LKLIVFAYQSGESPSIVSITSLQFYAFSMEKKMANQDIIVIGTSYGGVNALKKLVSYLPADLAASIFIAIHHTPSAKTILHEILTKEGKLPAVLPENGTRFQSGTIYVARPNFHLLVKQDHILFTFGPRENRVRPSINVLFRSAAASYTTRVIGVLLTGYQNDGVTGLSAIKRCGGTVIVQDPSEAEAFEMPKTAIQRVNVDYILKLQQIAEKISELSKHPAAAPPIEVPEDIMEEVRLSEYDVPDLNQTGKKGDITPYTCPDCGGVLWQAKNEPNTRYFCHTGHSYSEKDFLDGQAEVIENSLWEVIRFIQERADILINLAESRREKGFSQANEYKQQALQMKEHLHNIRRFIISGALNSSLYNNQGENKDVTVETRE
jgi:two-component system, chemotaxis family, protein-glutamate methylesterase/glutaminase